MSFLVVSASWFFVLFSPRTRALFFHTLYIDKSFLIKDPTAKFLFSLIAYRWQLIAIGLFNGLGETSFCNPKTWGASYAHWTQVSYCTSWCIVHPNVLYFQDGRFFFIVRVPWSLGRLFNVAVIRTPPRTWFLTEIKTKCRAPGGQTVILVNSKSLSLFHRRPSVPGPRRVDRCFGQTTWFNVLSIEQIFQRNFDRCSISIA